MKILDYFYEPNSKKHVFLNNGDALSYYTRHGWSIVRDMRDEGYVIMSKPAEVVLRISDNRGNVVDVDGKDMILSVYNRQKISVQLVQRFVKETNEGKWELAFDKNGNIICFKK